nr:hypothetical protein [Navicula tsukamotoi]
MFKIKEAQMYINYVSDRQKLGFSCIKDINAIKQLKITLKNQVIWIIRKGKQIVILLFSEETLVAAIIFLKSISVEPNVDSTSFILPKVYQSCVTKSDDLIFLNSPPRIVLKLKGGSDELSNNQQEKLVKSILAKAQESDYKEISINKFLKKILKLIDPVISNQKLWRILRELEKPLKPQLYDENPISSTDILDTAQNLQNKHKHTKSKSSSSSFAGAAFLNPSELSPMQKRVQLKMAMAQNNLESSGLSRNHEQLPENIQFIEKLTRLRRAQPLYPSQVLGDSYKYGGKQLERKAPRHLEDFGICIDGKTIEDLAAEYKDLLENIVSKPNLVIREDGTLNKQEPTINIGDPESLGIVSFENNPLYKDHHFISGYPISEEAFETFKETGNIGISSEERAQEINELQRTQVQAEREKRAAHSFYSSLPEEARIGNQQLREVEAIQERLREDPESPLTEKEKNMIKRAEKYQQYKTQYYQNNPDIDTDEF